MVLTTWLNFYLKFTVIFSSTVETSSAHRYHEAIMYSMWYPNSCILDIQTPEDTKTFVDAFHTVAIVSTTDRRKNTEVMYLFLANPYTVIGQREPTHLFLWRDFLVFPTGFRRGLCLRHSTFIGSVLFISCVFWYLWKLLSSKLRTLSKRAS